MPLPLLLPTMELKAKALQEEGIVVTWLRWKRLVSCWLLGVSAMPLTAQRRGAVEEPGQFRVIQVKEPNGQILTYSDLSKPTEVTLGGTSLAPEAHIKLRIQSAGSSSLFFIRKRRPGFLEIDINRGNIAGLKPAQQFGKDFLTYVLWAVSGMGKRQTSAKSVRRAKNPSTSTRERPTRLSG